LRWWSFVDMVIWCTVCIYIYIRADYYVYVYIYTHGF
jgi:hypothetical protein